MKTRQNPLLLSLALGTLLAPLAAHAATTSTRTSAFTYDSASGLLVKEVIEPDDSTLCLVTEYTYDAHGNKTASTTRNCNGSTGEAAAPTGDAVFTARTSNNTFDPRGPFPITSKNALGQSESKTYDPRFGSLTKLTGPNGLSTTWQYDDFGRKTLEIRADGTQTRWEYLYCYENGVGCPNISGVQWLIQETALASDGVTRNGPINKRYFDMHDREVRVETQAFNGLAIYKDTQYDSLGRPYKVSRPYYENATAYWTTATYDALGRVIQETQPDGSTVSTAYNGLTTTITDPLGRRTSSTTNSQGKVVKVVDAQNNPLTYRYDPFGNLLTTIDPRGNVVELTYDLRGRKIGMRDPDMGNWTYAYNALGELIRQTDAKGQVSTMVYDRLGRLTQRSENDLISNWYYDTYKGGAACQTGVGKLCQAETSTGYNRTVSYDTLGRFVGNKTTIDVPTPYSDSVSYDANGRIATQTYPNGLAVRYNYTPLGYLKSVSTIDITGYYWLADSGNSRDAEGHIQQQTIGGIVSLQSWDPASGRLNKITAGTGNAVQNLSYQYDKVGNLTTRTDGNQNLTENFIYDSLNRLTSSTVNSSGAGIVTKNYSYDAIGNITSKSDLGTYVYPANSARPHAVSQVTLSAGGKITFAYDANGALTTQTQTDAGNNTVAAKSRSQFYTSFNMPQSMAQGTISAAFYYGPEHQRVKQISSAQGTTVYVNPDNEGGLFFEKDIKPDGSIEQRAFINAGGQTVAVSRMITAGGTTTTSTAYLHHDALGSVTAITNNKGEVLERLAYEPFGKRRFASGANDPNNTIMPQNIDRGFTGHEMLDEIGLVHMNGRVYDPLVGRFLSADPYIQSPGNLQSYNRYSYVMNNPLGYTDPSGYSWWTKIRNIVIRVAAAVADAYGCSGYCSAAVGAYQGYQSGGVGGAITGGIGGYVGYQMSVNYPMINNQTGSILWQNVAIQAPVSGAIGCASASAGGGSCGQGALAGAVGTLGSAFAGGEGFGRMFGSGINGYLQTGTLQGFVRGFAAGAIPQDLLFTDAYKDNAFANVAIGITRDGIRGSLAEGSLKGFGEGVIYGQATNAVGHLVGLATTGALPKFDDGAFIYEGDFWSSRGAMTFGNVISGSKTILASLMLDSSYTVLEHERAHIPQSSILGALYIPVQGLMLGATGHSRYNFLECNSTWISVPHGGTCN